MSKLVAVAVLCPTILFLGSSPVSAQGPSTPADRTIRQGDTIEWSAVSGGVHRVRFGGTVGTTPLTPVSEINAVIDNFSPALNLSGELGESPTSAAGTLLTAKVKEDNATVGKTFTFTCGIHTSQMLTETFTIAAKDATQPARTHKIKGVAGPHWFMEVPAPPPTKDVQVDTAP